jgi:hypothetical protein
MTCPYALFGADTEQQGQLYKKVNRIFSDSGKIHVAPLQLTSAPYLSSISEAMQGNDSTLSSSDSTTKMTISNNEEEFNKTLVEYSTLYNTFSEEFLKKNTPAAPGPADATAPGPAGTAAPGTAPAAQRLIALNNKLVNLADKINQEIGTLKVTDANLKKQIDDQQSTLSTYISQFREQQNKMTDMDINVDGLAHTSELALVSNKYHYLVWFILGLTLIAIGLYTITNDNVSNSVVLVVSLLTIYFVSLWINNEYIRYQ